MLMFLREELTSLPKMRFVRRFACLVDPQPKGALHAFGRVWEWSNNAHEAFSWVCVHGRAIFGPVQHSSWCIQIDEWSVVSPRATRAVDGAVLQASFECKGTPACVWECSKHA